MTILDLSAGHYILINTFTVEPENAHALLKHLSKATKDIFQHAPGFVSANLHLSADCTRVANYAQWRSREDYLTAVKNPETEAHMREAASYATAFDPIFYELVETHLAKPAA